MEFIDFGCGRGDSMSFAHRVLSGDGIGIDKSSEAIEATTARGFEARLGDVTSFDVKNVAPVALSFDLMQELERRSDFEVALRNIVASCTNCAVIQHSFFDADGVLAHSGRYIKANFHKKVCFKPMTGDYATFAKRHETALSISGIAVFGFGQTQPLSLEDDVPSEGAGEFRSLRVVFGRKESRRFHRALEQFGTGQALYAWQAA